MKLYSMTLIATFLLAASCGDAPDGPEMIQPATIKDIMTSMVDPAGDFLFESVQEIADARGITRKAPSTDAEWDEVRQRLFVLVESGNLMAMEGRKAAGPMDRAKNPPVEKEPEEIQRLMDAGRADFLDRTRALQNAAMLAMRAVNAKNVDGLFASMTVVDAACEGCHVNYWYPPADK